MSLIDMLTDIKSFNYNKVGKKHGEYFGEDNATGFTTDRETKSASEFKGVGEKFNSNASVYSKIKGVDFFTNENRPGFLFDMTETFDKSKTSLYIPNSGNDFNFKNKIGYSRFDDTNQTGFTIDRNTKDETEFIIGSGNDYNFKTPTAGVDFFYNTHAEGFVLNKVHKDSSDFVGIQDLTFDGKSSLYGDIESNTLGTDDDYDGIRDASAPKLMSKPDLELINTDYTKISAAKGDVEFATNKGKIRPKESKEYITTLPNKPQTPMFSEDHPYGAQPPYIELENRGKDTDEQYIKFGGNAGLRPGYPSNANQGVLGSDSPYIIKEVGDRYDSLNFAVDDTITILPFKVVRTAEDVIRIGKWTLTAKGIIWNATQFMLQAQNARGVNRLFNPLGPLGSLVPYVHLPRHTDGSFTDFKEPPIYPDKFTDDLHSLRHEEGQAASNPISQAADDLLDAGSKGLNIQISNRLENLRYYRIEKNKGPVPNLNPLASLGFGNKSFVDPTHHVKSMKGPSGGNLNEDGQFPGSPLITKYSDLESYNENSQLASDVIVGDNLADTAEDAGFGQDVKYETLIKSDVVKKGKGLEHANDYNLGRGLIKSTDGIYSVGVSNQLQVPYGGKFSDLEHAVGTPDNTLPTDFIKFRIRDAVNGKWLIFPAHLGAVTDTVSPEYSKERYIGRPDDVHIYNGTSRTISFDFKVAAFTKQEIPIIQEKMNYLVGLGYPTYKKILQNDSEVRPVAPYIYLTIGDMFNNTPGYFDNIALSTEENANWEIDEGFQIPMVFNVSVNFVYIGRYLPQTLGKHYDVPWLVDSGAPYGTFGLQDPRDGTPGSVRPLVDGEQEWSTTLTPNEAV